MLRIGKANVAGLANMGEKPFSVFLSGLKKTQVKVCQENNKNAVEICGHNLHPKVLVLCPLSPISFFRPIHFLFFFLN